MMSSTHVQAKGKSQIMPSPEWQAIAENLPPSRLLAWLMTFPAFVVVAHVLDTLLLR